MTQVRPRNVTPRTMNREFREKERGNQNMERKVRRPRKRPQKKVPRNRKKSVDAIRLLFACKQKMEEKNKTKKKKKSSEKNEQK